MPPRGRSHGFEEEKLPEKLNLGVWVRIGRYAIRHWPFLLLLLLFMVFTTFYDSAFVPGMNKAALEAAAEIPTLANIGELPSSAWELPLDVNLLGIHFEMTYLTYTILFGTMVLIRSVSIFATFFFTNYLGMLIMVDLRRESFKKIQELSFSYFDKTSSGWLIARMNNDTSSIGDILSNGVINLLWAVFEIVFTIITMFTMDWRLGLVILASLPLVMIIVPIFEKKILQAHRTARNAYSHYVGWLAESIDGAKTIKTLGIEEEIASEADSITEDIQIKRFKAGRINAFFQPILSVISYFMIGLIVYLGLSHQFDTSWAISIGTTIIYIGFVGSIYNPLQQIAESFSEFMATQAGAEKVMQLLEAVPSIQDTPEAIAKYGDLFHPKEENYVPLEGKIDFEHVYFDYGNGVEVIHDLDLHIKKGTYLAIVGETGSGKTTTVNLLCRFYEPTKGRILVDDQDYMSLSLGYLRSQIGYVQQNPYVFMGSYRDNIAYGKPNASLEEIKKAAEMVGIASFIEKEKNGYDTVLEDGGNALSQGQKQLLSYARAIVRDPALLILDEATSSIDTKTEKSLQEATSCLLKGRTSIVIAHRLSTIVNADRILLMDHGVIIEDGDHKTLMEKKGAYYNLYMNQFKELSLDGQLEEFEKSIKGKDVKI